MFHTEELIALWNSYATCMFIKIGVILLKILNISINLRVCKDLSQLSSCPQGRFCYPHFTCKGIGTPMVRWQVQELSGKNVKPGFTHGPFYLY